MDLSPVTHERIGAQLDKLDFNWGLDKDGDITLAFPDIRFFFGLTEGSLTLWGGLVRTARQEQADELLAFARKHNATTVFPKIFLNDEPRLCFSSSLTTKCGVSDEQLEKFITLILQLSLRAAESAITTFPALSHQEQE